MIYFAHATGTDLVKIGFTAGDPLNRLGDLQTGCPHEIALLASIEGREEDEAKWHAEFATDRERGEWFRLTPRLMVRIILAAVGRPAACDLRQRIDAVEDAIVDLEMRLADLIPQRSC